MASHESEAAALSRRPRLVVVDHEGFDPHRLRSFIEQGPIDIVLVGQPSATSNAVTFRVSRLNSTPIRWIGSPRPRYLAA